MTVCVIAVVRICQLLYTRNDISDYVPHMTYPLCLSRMLLVRPEGWVPGWKECVMATEREKGARPLLWRGCIQDAISVPQSKGEVVVVWN